MMYLHGTQVVAGLAYLHTMHVVHRDIKSLNILLCRKPVNPLTPANPDSPPSTASSDYRAENSARSDELDASDDSDEEQPADPAGAGAPKSAAAVRLLLLVGLPARSLQLNQIHISSIISLKIIVGNFACVVILVTIISKI